MSTHGKWLKQRLDRWGVVRKVTQTNPELVNDPDFRPGRKRDTRKRFGNLKWRRLELIGWEGKGTKRPFHPQVEAKRRKWGLSPGRSTVPVEGRRWQPVVAVGAYPVPRTLRGKTG